MYSDEVTLSGSNVMEVLYLAKKYMVPSLADKCTEYLQDNLHPSNVFSILLSVQKLEIAKKILVVAMATVCKRNTRCVANLYCECQKLKRKGENNSSLSFLLLSTGVGNVCIQAKWHIRPELILVSAA